MNRCGTRSRWLCVLHSITSPTFWVLCVSFCVSVQIHICEYAACVFDLCLFFSSVVIRARISYMHKCPVNIRECLFTYEWYVYLYIPTCSGCGTVQKKTRHDADITVLYFFIFFLSFFLRTISRQPHCAHSFTFHTLRIRPHTHITRPMNPYELLHFRHWLFMY